MCRFIVVQQRSAIAVEDPLALSAYLERLAGLGDVEASIATKTAEVQVATQQCEALAAESERCGSLHYAPCCCTGPAFACHVGSLSGVCKCMHSGSPCRLHIATCAMLELPCLPQMQSEKTYLACRLHARRAELAPHVERWQAFRSQMESFQTRKREQLERQAAALGANIVQLTNKARSACAPIPSLKHRVCWTVQPRT